METETAVTVTMSPPAAEPRKVAANVAMAFFSAAEVAEITGVQVDTQRIWRARGHMPNNDGRWLAQTSIFGLSRTLALFLLSKRAGFRDIASAAEAASYAIAWHALGWLNAWDGDVRRVGTWDAEWAAKALTLPDRGWPQQAGWLREMMWERAGLEVNKSRWLVVWADNSFSFCDDLDDATARVAGTLLTAGPMMALDLQSCGYNLVELAGRPFASLELDLMEDSNR